MPLMFLMVLCSLDKGHVAFDHPFVEITGARYAHPVEGGLELLRFPEEVLALDKDALQADPLRARTTSGASIVFRMTAPSATVNFYTETVPYGRDARFTVLVDEQVQREFYFSKTVVEQPIAVTNPNPDSPVTVRVCLPSWSNPIFTGIGLPDNEELLDPEQPDRKVYVAIGDSITHGTGQGGSSQKTYAWLLSEKLDCELFNLAVGGGKVSLPIAQSVSDWEQVDLFTVLVGYNDWNLGKTMVNYRQDLDDLVTTLRAAHPVTPLFLIRQTFTTTESPLYGQASLSDYRDAVSTIVEQRRAAGDTNIFVISGDALTDASMLHDAVHLNVDGAAQFADSLYSEIEPKL